MGLSSPRGGIVLLIFFKFGRIGDMKQLDISLIIS